jgi:hypothetical protein
MARWMSPLVLGLEWLWQASLLPNISETKKDRMCCCSLTTFSDSPKLDQRFVHSSYECVGLGTVPQGCSQVSFPITSLDFSGNPIVIVLGLTRPLTEMSTRNLPRGNRIPAHKAQPHHHLWASCLGNKPLSFFCKLSSLMFLQVHFKRCY